MAGDDLIEQLKARILELEERVRQLEAAAGVGFRPPLSWGLTPSQQRMFGVLMKRDLASKAALHLALPTNGSDASPDPKIVDVQICKMRKRLLPFGVEIATVWGYRLTAAAKAAAEAMLAEEKAA